METNHRIFIALGSSIGDALSRFDSTQSWLESHQIKIIAKSKNYTFPPYGGVAQNEFTNAVWEIEHQTSEKDLEAQAHQLLTLLQQCEADHGRTRHKRWEDRTLDLDILMYKNLTCQTKDLTLPHPEMAHRDFVQIPLQELLKQNPDLKTKTQTSIAE